ncbi:Acyl-CoA dehydrogenase [Streptomyces venezuelae]|uniref:acyl-CoA dehydrogenase family protein n=1 Tax=Streptomyces gardneri TaxID=66892 RepID=UPI0006BD68E2|nr:acyl-CoA dehydrogenase [Streptomyces gardneri]ALO06165.1 Acyl-CoA dehydrogenase [Streptomyces venezuelae]QPK43637.1 acyl-CoA dehydrogenase [Streptomyces gardneri]WRK34888.1 acyl-CoA dehydrogenase [Streptomyces venezuelae]CUM43592.1 Acyl-CoA dehydrogenase, short-chain specific [Streptomyces venezuelae]
MPYTLEPSYDDDPRLRELVVRLRAYLNDELLPYERERGITPESRVDRPTLEHVWKRSRELGFYGISLPPELGGQGIGFTELCALKEELTASGAALSHSVLGDMGGPLRVGAIVKYATADQLERYLMPVVRGERACCFSITEEDAGSDVRRMRTTATPDGDSYVLDGHKVFSSAAPFADFAIVVARMAGTEEAYSAFLVDLDTPGCRVLDGEVPMSGQQMEGDLVFENCRIPAENLLGEIGQGLRIGIGRITLNRLLHCPSLIGAARRAWDLSVAHAKSRVAFGQPLLALQAVQHKLADMATEVYAARSLVMATAARADRGENIAVEANMCKLFASEACFRVADQAVQIHGKAGLTRGHEVEQIFRTLRMFRIVTGTTEIHKNAIAKALV